MVSVSITGLGRIIRLVGVVLVAIPGCNKDVPANGGQSRSTTSGQTYVAQDVKTSSGIEMAALPAGTFTMGSNSQTPEEGPAHEVTLAAFDIDKYPVTHDMFVKVQLPDPSHWPENPKAPVERIRWGDAKRYCNERSLAEHLTPCYNEKTPNWECDFTANGYRLPTEAEWEYAARAGSTEEYDFGAVNKLPQYAWFTGNSGKKTHPVGDLKPNGFGLFDMYGNVSVWCEDVYEAKYYTTSPKDNPHGPISTSADVKRVMRGGNWKASAAMCRATIRMGERTGNTDACFSTDFCGMRCVRNHQSGLSVPAIKETSK